MFNKTLFVLAAAIPISFLHADNLIKNGDFSSATLAPWLTPQAKNLHKIKDGKLVVNGDPGNKYNSFITMVQYLPELKKGKNYLLSADALPQIKKIGKKWQLFLMSIIMSKSCFLIIPLL